MGRAGSPRLPGPGSHRAHLGHRVSRFLLQGPPGWQGAHYLWKVPSCPNKTLCSSSGQDIGEVWPALAAYRVVTNYDKFGGLKQHILITGQVYRLESEWPSPG